MENDRTKDIKAIGFDWDGTLVDSMVLKSRSFAKATIAQYPELEDKRAEVERTYLATRGNPRTDQLKVIQGQYGLEPLPEAKLAEWSDAFTADYIDKVPPLFPQVEETLGALRERGYVTFLASSVPQGDLDETLTRYDPSLRQQFAFAIGTRDAGAFRKGLPHLSYAAEQLGIGRGEIAFCGDGKDDVIGAREAGSLSVGKINDNIPRAREEILGEEPDIAIVGLEELLEHFPGA